MTVRIIYPSGEHSAYLIAAETFRSLAEQVSPGVECVVMDDDVGCTEMRPGEKLVILGDDSVNSVTADLYLRCIMDPLCIKYGTDSYTIRSLTMGDNEALLLAGGRPRAVLYAVYRYFELYCGCSWFWDGDRIGKCELRFSGIDCSESPRFEYRGLRYFAHRSLHRFQAEHWSLEDWKTEIDWLLKKRFNMFMLRIGLDDLYQKAFPDIVHYPEPGLPLPEAGEGFDDRNLFWSLQYRGELRKAVLEYAFERDLIHPEDCGTMTHWYSRTPVDYLKAVRPKLLMGQITSVYSEETGLVWDIRDKDNLKQYFKLTEAHMRSYGRNCGFFHTIGLAERNFSEKREENLRLKLNVYHRILNYLRTNYPNSKLLLASWDMWMFYKPEEVRRLCEEMDPEQAVIFDYTSDTVSSNNFTKWGVMGKFPWVFGIFNAYEPNNEIRGDYYLITERTRVAKADPMCKGYVLWPELSHGDTFCGEYTAYQAWNEDTPSPEQMVHIYCEKRYLLAQRQVMEDLWLDFLPLIGLRSWSMTESTLVQGTDLFFNLCTSIKYSPKDIADYRASLVPGIALQMTASSLLRSMASLENEANTDDLLRRDIFDIARTVTGRYINFGIMRAGTAYADKDTERLRVVGEQTRALLAQLGEILSLHDDFSMYDSLLKLRTVADTNPDFEVTLKHNGDNGYCRSYIAEFVRYLYIPECQIFFDAVLDAAESGASIDFERMHALADENRAIFHDTPLSQMQGDRARTMAEIFRRTADCIDAMQLKY